MLISIKPRTSFHSDTVHIRDNARIRPPSRLVSSSSTVSLSPQHPVPKHPIESLDSKQVEIIFTAHVTIKLIRYVWSKQLIRWIGFIWPFESEHVSMTTISWLMLFKEMITASSEDLKKLQVLGRTKSPTFFTLFNNTVSVVFFKHSKIHALVFMVTSPLIIITLRQRVQLWNALLQSSNFTTLKICSLWAHWLSTDFPHATPPTFLFQ
jgi:hypothetical protein